MKKEEAIKRLKWFKDYNEDDYCGGDRIKNEYGEWYYKVDEEDLEAFDEAIKFLEGSSWIPVSERLPKKSGKYWCTFGGTNFMGSDYYTTETSAVLFFDDPEEYAGWRSKNVVAWMPLPKPYVPDTNIGKMSEIPTGCSNSDSCENCKYSDGDCCRLIYEAKMFEPQESEE